MATGGYFSNDQTVSSSFAMSKIRAGKAYTLNITLSRYGVSFNVDTDDWLEPIMFAPGVDLWKDAQESIDLDTDETSE